MTNNIKLNGEIKMKGEYTIVNLKNGEFRESENLIMDVGKSQLASLALSDISTGTAFDYLAIGVGSSTVVSTQTTLGSEYKRVSGTGFQSTTNVLNDTATLSGTFFISDAKVINEAAIFNNSALDTGSMLSRTTFSDLTLISGDAIAMTYRVVFA